MYKKILLAYDGSEEGRKALVECADLAQLLKAEVHLLAVIPFYAGMMVVEGMVMENDFEQEKKRFQAILDEGIARLKARGCIAEGTLANGEPVDEIGARAKAVGAELICVGHRRAKSWAERWWRGSVGKNLVDIAECSVLVAMV
jgi:nucleotide-binding universal stress UspA family protein